VGVLVIRDTPQRVRRGQVVALREARTLIGRGRKVHVLLDDPGVSEYHAVINYEQRSSMHCFTLYPLGGRTVEVNGNAVRPAACLRTGDRIRVGSSELVFFQVSLKSGAA
jgi:pSer/pThr/pTyr-binding forkhead associated (FHA) protein